jgi:hypothetical protein
MDLVVPSGVQREGRVSPRFNTVDEMLASLKSGRKTPRQTGAS